MDITVNGIKLHYEVYGEGHPLIMVHGNGESHKIFEPAIQTLKKYYTVYAIDSRDHGESEKVETLHYDDMAQDVYEFIQALGLEKPYFYGFSDGGILGLLLASKYPDLFGKMVLSGPSLNPHSTVTRWYIIFWLMAKKDKSDKSQLMLREPHITKEDLRKITVPTVITGGSHDMIRRSHLKKITRNIRNARLKIYHPYGHIIYISNNKRWGKKLHGLLEDLEEQ